MTFKKTGPSAGTPAFSAAPNREEAARLILKGICVLLEVAEQMETVELIAKLRLAKDEAVRQLDGLTKQPPSAH